jgi:D-alanyl-D-alanine carboxypeptidase
MTKHIVSVQCIFFMLILISACEKDISKTQNLLCEDQISNLNHPKKDDFNRVIDKYIKLGLPGISVLVEDENGIFTSSSGMADIENNIAFSSCHVSKAASITKLMVGTLTFMLQEDGKLNLDDPISKYIDEAILSKLENAEGKTIRQLMNHSTGIYDLITSSAFYLAVLNNPNKAWSQTELLKFAYHQNGYSLNAPYPAYYSNTNTCLLSMCIEKATGTPHHELLREKLLNPLQMTSTYYQSREKLPETTAQGYFDLHNNQTIVNVSNLITGSGNGYGGMFSNVYDLRKFIRALLIDKTLISDSSLAEMTEFLQEDEDFFTGAGMIKKFTKKSAFGIGHTGRDLGYSADLFYFPEKDRTMIFFVNYGTNGSSSLKPIFLDFESELADVVLQD